MKSTNNIKKSRREFIKLTGISGLALGASAYTPFRQEVFSEKAATAIKFINPIDGDMLCKLDGTVSAGSLITKVKIAAPAASRIKVNGLTAKNIGGIFDVDITLDKYENVIELTEENSGYKENIKIFWLKNFANKYRLSLDDNIWFLEDIYRNEDKYKSIF